MPRVVFDTNVFVRALIRPFGRWGQLVYKYFPEYTLVVSGPAVVELLDVLRRPQIARKFRPVEGLDVTRVLDLIGQAVLVDVDEISPVSRDPKDDVFLATAVSGGASFLVTEDQDLLVLGEYEGVQIIDSLRFLQVLSEGRQDR